MRENETEPSFLGNGAYLVLGRPEVPDSIEIGRRYALNSPVIMIANQKEAEIFLAAPEEKHYSLVLFYHPQRGWMFENKGARSTVLLNGFPSEERRLQDGDLLQIGETIFHFLEGVGVFSGIYAQLFRASRIDLLTNAYNAAHFDASLEDWMNLSKRHKQALSLLLIDIDWFKKINDTYGHVPANAVLRELAQRIFKRLRKGDIFCRYGGEEMTLILPETPPDHAFQLAEEIRQAIADEPFVYEHFSIPVTVSIGVAEYLVGMSKDDFVKVADERMYEAKHSGKNKVVGYNPTL